MVPKGDVSPLAHSFIRPSYLTSVQSGVTLKACFRSCRRRKQEAGRLTRCEYTMASEGERDSDILHAHAHARESQMKRADALLSHLVCPEREGRKNGLNPTGSLLPSPLLSSPPSSSPSQSILLFSSFPFKNEPRKSACSPVVRCRPQKSNAVVALVGSFSRIVVISRPAAVQTVA